MKKTLTDKFKHKNNTYFWSSYTMRSWGFYRVHGLDIIGPID